MAAPKGDYTPKSGPLAGRTFHMQPGDAPTAPYNRYQQARAEALGFEGYSQERREIHEPIFKHLENRMIAVQGISRAEARRQVHASGVMRERKYAARQGSRGYDQYADRKAAAVEWAIDEGLYDSGSDAADEIPY